MTTPPTPDPALDLVFERIADVPRELIWKAWTTPDHLKRWFTPAPWTTAECEIDLRPGGIFRTVMRSADGQEMANLGCYLEVVDNERLVWTNAMKPGFRLSSGTATGADGRFLFTAVITLEAHGAGTKYTATLMHADEAGAKRHAAMGFQEGWGAAFEQLLATLRPA